MALIAKAFKYVPVLLTVILYLVYIAFAIVNAVHAPEKDAAIVYLVPSALIIVAGLLLRIPLARDAAIWFPVLSIPLQCYRLYLFFADGEKYPYNITITPVHTTLQITILLLPVIMLLELSPATAYFTAATKWRRLALPVAILNWKWPAVTTALIYGIYGIILIPRDPPFLLPLLFIAGFGVAFTYLSVIQAKQWRYRFIFVTMPLVLLLLAAYLPVNMSFDPQADRFGSDALFLAGFAMLGAFFSAPIAVSLLLFPSTMLQPVRRQTTEVIENEKTPDR